MKLINRPTLSFSNIFTIKSLSKFIWKGINNGAISWVSWTHYVKIIQLVSRLISIMIGVSPYPMYFYWTSWNSQHFFFAITFGIYCYFRGEAVVVCIFQELVTFLQPNPCHNVSFNWTLNVVDCKLDGVISNRLCQIAFPLQIRLVF